MARQVQVTAERIADRSFKCATCGARGVVAFTAIGRGAWAKESTFHSTSAAQRAGESAQHDLTVDEDRVLDLIACPTCARRAPRATTWMIVRPIAWLVAAGVSLAALGTDPGIWPTIFFVGVAGWQTSREYGRVVRAGTATFSQLTPGTPPSIDVKSRPRPKPTLPIARAIAAPPIAPKIAPKIAVAVAPPVSIAPRTATDEPAFLAPRDDAS